MLPTRSELMYFTMGIAVGGVVGANWSKIKPLLEAFMGPAAEGFRDAYADLARQFAEKNERRSDRSAERSQQSRQSRKKPKKTKKAPMTAADFAQAFMFNSSIR